MISLYTQYRTKEIWLYPELACLVSKTFNAIHLVYSTFHLPKLPLAPSTYPCEKLRWSGSRGWILLHQETWFCVFRQGSASPSLHHTLPRRVPDRAELCFLQTEACSIHWEVAGDSAGRPKDGESNDYTVAQLRFTIDFPKAGRASRHRSTPPPLGQQTVSKKIWRITQCYLVVLS